MTEQNNVPTEEQTSSEDLKQEENKATVSEDLKNEDMSGQERDTDDFYKQELEKVKAHKENLEKGIKARDSKIKELQSEEINEEVLDKVVERIDQRFEEREKRIAAQKVEDETASLIAEASSSPSEAELIRHYLDNRIKRSGFSKAEIIADVQEAKLLANKKKFMASSEAYNNLNKTRATVDTSPTFANELPERPSDMPSLTREEQALLNRTNARRQKRGDKPMTAKDIRRI